MKSAGSLLEKKAVPATSTSAPASVTVLTFASPIPPRSVNLNFQITPAIREAFKNPNDRGVQ